MESLLFQHHHRQRKDKVVVIMGATGTGKVKLAIDLATHFPPSEIVNSDKMQVYKGLDITTNKVTEEECRGVPHHLLGLFSYGGPHAMPGMVGYPIPYSDVPYDYAWPRVLYSPISSFHLGSYGDVWSPYPCPHCSVANESTVIKTIFSNSSLFHVSHESGYPPIFQINLQGVFNNYAGATINIGENSGNRYTYDNHGGNSIYNSGNFIGNGNGSSIGGDFDASTRNYY